MGYTQQNELTKWIDLKSISISKSPTTMLNLKSKSQKAKMIPSFSSEWRHHYDPGWSHPWKAISRIVLDQNRTYVPCISRQIPYLLHHQASMDLFLFKCNILSKASPQYPANCLTPPPLVIWTTVSCFIIFTQLQICTIISFIHRFIYLYVHKFIYLFIYIFIDL